MVDERYYRRFIARLIMGILLVSFAWWLVAPGAGEHEFERAQQALKSVKSWKFAQLRDSSAITYQEGGWEVDCAAGWHGVLHTVSRANPESPFDETIEQGRFGQTSYYRYRDREWQSGPASTGPGPDPSAACTYLAQGESHYPFPNFKGLIGRANIVKKSVKTVSGVRCREWLAQVLRRPGTGTEEYTICLGLKDHLPYEVSGTWESHLIFSDYNELFKLHRGPLEDGTTHQGQ